MGEWLSIRSGYTLRVPFSLSLVLSAEACSYARMVRLGSFRFAGLSLHGEGMVTAIGGLALDRGVSENQREPLHEFACELSRTSYGPKERGDMAVVCSGLACTVVGIGTPWRRLVGTGQARNVGGGLVICQTRGNAVVELVSLG